MSLLSGVLDANGVIGLAHGDVFELLSSLCDPLYIPPAVREEVITQGQGLPGEGELSAALGHWVTEASPSPHLVQQFAAIRSPADRQVLALAREKMVDHVLTGDERLLRVATRLGFQCLRPTEIVVLMKRQGLIAEVKPVIDRMRQRGFGIHTALHQAALRAAGE